MSNKENLIKVALTAARPGRVTYARRVIYSSFYRGEPVRAPSPGVTIAGYYYDPHELIPANVIMLADRAERDRLFELIDQDKKARQESRQPGPGQLNEQEIDQDTLDRQRRENALAFFPPNVIASRGHSNKHRSNYEAMYDWMMDYFRDWYNNLSDDQELQARSFGRRIAIAKEMNPYLRGDRTRYYEHSSDAIEEGIHVFDSLVDDAPPIDRDMIVYRGIPDTISLVPRGASLKKGDVIDNNQFMSSTIDPSIATDAFMGGSYSPNQLLMRIVLPKGTRTAPVTTWNINNEGTSKSDFATGSGSHEMEFTLPRDSKLRIVSEPHEEDFEQNSNIKKIRVADFELVPQPTPEESPELPHREINSFRTGGRKDFNDEYNDDDDSNSDPWDGYDPDDMKSDKASDLEKIIDDYEDDPGHDTEALEQIKNLKFDLDTIDHTDYGDPDEYDQAMAEVVSNAENIVSNAPDHTDELWANFNPKDEQAKVLGELASVISRFARNHDTTRPVIADYLKQLKSIQYEVSRSLEGDIRERYTYPDEYSDDLSKYLLKAHTLVDLGHALDQDQKSGQPPLFLGQDASYHDLENWLVRKKSFDQNVIKIREFDPGLADQVQELWDKATHGVGLGSDSQSLMNLIEKGSARYANGISPEASGFGLVKLSDMTRAVNHQLMLHKSIKDNISRAKSQGIFQGSDVPDAILKEWARKLHEFRNNLDDYRKKQEAAGNPVSPQAAQAQIYWDRATKELLPSYETMAILARLVDYSEALKEGYAQDYGLADIKSRLNSQLVIQGSPSAKLGAKLDQLNDRYREANERFVNSPYYDKKHLGYLEKFKDYIKSKGVDGTKLEHIEKLPPEIQEQIFAQANALVTNLNKASNGSLGPSQIWPTPVEHIQAPASPSVASTMDKLRYKASKQKILSQFMDTVFKYNKTSFYDINYHKKLNDLMDRASNDYPDGPDQLAAMREVARRADDLLDQKPNSVASLHAPLPEVRPAPTKFLTTHFFTKQDWSDLYNKKLKEYMDATDKYAVTPAYDFQKHVGLDEKFFMNSNPGNIKQKLENGTPESNQAIIDNFDNIITHAKALAGLTEPAVAAPHKSPVASPVDTNTPTPDQDWHDLFKQKRQEFKTLMEEYMNSPNYSQDTHHQLGMAFWNKKLPPIVEANYLKASPDVKQATLDHFDDMIFHAKNTIAASMPPPSFAPTPVPEVAPNLITQDKPDKSFEDMFSDAGEISYKLHNYEDMPLANQEKLGEFGDRYNDLRDKWYKDPKNDLHIMAQLTHLYNDVSRETEEHSDKLTKIASHAQEIQPQLASGPGLRELETKFPERTSQIHLDMANYKKSPHFDPMSYGLMVDLVDHMAKNWEEKKDPEITHDDLKDIMKYTKKQATNNGTLPHESILPAAPKPLFEAPHPPLASGTHTLPAPGKPPGRRSYGRLDRQTAAAIKVALNMKYQKLTIAARHQP